jgi:ribosome-binding protein aMBF1 (putative translation factor)
MGVFQINLWICELCGSCTATAEVTSQYSDPLVMPPIGAEWSYHEIDGKELLLCPKCAEGQKKKDDTLTLTGWKK